ncbi:MAG: ATP-dependent Clp protease ATP-binding subunit, partial [Prevotella sp.]|nr:ATP-dependent Clp protease ATP-binding subunit [Prevotella sp.]
QFEERIKALINEIEQHPELIVFIDEIHTIIGAGSAAGTMDAANILKPALARGVIQCIGATTLDEYRNSIEKDGALERRFQKIIVNPSSKDETLKILQNIKDRYEKYHHVSYTDDAIKACVELTERYVSDRAFPDKAIDALDEAGAHIHLKHANIPPEITEMEEKIEETKRLKQEAVKNQNFELAAQYRDQQLRLANQLEELNSAWMDGNNETKEKVNDADIANVVSIMTGVPVQRIATEENERLRIMGDELKKSVVAQDNAINKIVRAIQRNRLGLRNPNHPVGVFLFLGPTGVGKTYLAKKLAEHMFGSETDLIRIDMSEYSESFNVSRLVGAPPGYVGYEEGGQLTEKVRRKPYSIVLLDEIEKANAAVFNMLLQVLDDGRLTDGNGRLIDFRNTIVIMTSNTGTRQLKEFGRGIGFGVQRNINGPLTKEDKEYAQSVIQKSLSKQFAPEFLNRLDDIIIFDQLDKSAIRLIVDIELKSVLRRISNIGYEVEISDDAKDYIASKGYDVQFGARPLKRALQQYIEDGICERIMESKIKKGTCIHIDYNENSKSLDFS